MGGALIVALAIVGVIWWTGFIVAGLGYYWWYHREGPSMLRLIAAIFWPIGIPADLMYRRLRK